MLAMLWRLNKAVLEICFMCELKDSSWSKMIPRFLTGVLEAKAMPSRLTMLMYNEFLMCVRPSTSTSVLSEFNNKKLSKIQFLISLRHVWSLVNGWVSSVFTERYECMYVICIAVKTYGLLPNDNT